MMMGDKIKTGLLWIFSFVANWLAWFELHADLIAKSLAVFGAIVTITVTIFHALTLRQKYRYYKYKADNEKEK